MGGHEAEVTAVKFSGDGRLLASGSKDCDIRVWLPDLNNPTLYGKFAAHEAWIRDLEFSGDQHYLFTAAGDGMVWAWDVPRSYHKKQAPPAKSRGGAKKYTASV